MAASLSTYVSNLNLGGTDPRHLNLGGTDAENLLAQYKPAVNQLNKLYAELASAQAQPSTPANVRARLTLQSAVQDQTLQVDALKSAYLTSQEGLGSASIVQVLNRAQGASNNRHARLEELAFAGLVIGLLVGLGLAIWRSGNIKRRSLSRGTVS